MKRAVYEPKGRVGTSVRDLMEPLTVAFDAGPMVGPRSGIGLAVRSLHTDLQGRDDIALLEYLVGVRGVEGVRPLRFPFEWSVQNWSRWGHPKMDWRLRPAEVVHGTNYLVPPTALPTVVTVHDTWYLRHPDSAAPLVRRAGTALQRALRNGATVHTSSQATAASVRELFPHVPVEVIPLGPLPVPPAPAQSPIAPVGDRPFIVAIGALERRRNLPSLVRAFAAIAAEEPEPLLVLAGRDGDDLDAVMAAIDATGPAISARILRAGPIDSAARAWLLRHASVLALPSYDEGFGFPLLDAMQVDLPLVASDAGAIAEVAGDAALLSAPDDVAALAENLRLALTDEVTRRRLVAAGRRQCRRFSWERTGTQISALYHRLRDAPGG